MENKKYNRVMERVEVTPEMRARILANIEKTDVSPVRRKAVSKLPIVIGIAAALLVVSFGIYGIIGFGSKMTDSESASPGMKVRKNDAVEGIMERTEEAETVADSVDGVITEGAEEKDDPAYGDTQAAGIRTDSSIRDNLTIDENKDGKTFTFGNVKNRNNALTSVDINKLFAKTQSIEYKTEQGLTVKVTDEDTVQKFIEALTQDYEIVGDDNYPEASIYDLFLETGNIKVTIEVYGNQLKAFNHTYRASSDNLETELKTIILKEEQ